MKTTALSAPLADTEPLRQFVEQAPAVMAMFDRNMRYLACSRRWLAYHGSDDQIVTGRCHYDVFPKISERWREIHRRGLAGETLRSEDDVFHRADGQAHLVRWEMRPWLESDQTIGGITIIAEDVTDRVETSQALRENELRMRLAQEAARVGTWDWRLADDRTEWSENLWSLYGLKPGQCPPSLEAWEASIHPDDRERVINFVRKEASLGREYETQWRVNLPKGEPERWLSARGSPIAGADGKPERYIGIVIDITKQKQTEEALRKAKERERQKREDLEAILAAIPAPVLIATDASCENMIGNPAAYELYRVPPGANIAKSAPVGKAPANFEIFQNGRRLIGEELPIRRAAAKRTFSGEEIELRFVEGDSKYLLGNALPLLDEAGETRGAVAAFADVTELKRKETALREADERLQFALDAAKAGTWEVDLATGKIIAGPRALSVLGFPSGVALTYDLVLSQAHPDDQPLLAEAHRRTVETGASHRLEWRACLPDGSIRWLETRGECRFIRGAKVIAGLAFDITERKRTEQALVASGAKLEAALASMSDAVFISDNESNIIHFNEAFATYHKFKTKDECAKTFAEYSVLFDVSFPNGDVAPPDRWGVPRALRGETVIGAEYRLRRKDTGESWIGSYNFAPIRDGGGKIVGSVVTSRDITEKKRAEAALRESEERKRAASAKLEAALASMSDALFITDEKGDVVHFNEAFAAYHRFKSKEDCARAFAEYRELFEVFFLPNGDSAPPDRWAAQRALEGETAVGAEYCLRRRDTGESWIGSYNFAPIRDAGGKIVGSVVTARDITEQKRTQGTLANALRREAIGQLAAGVAHDFNNLLQVIEGYLDLAQDLVREGEARVLIQHAQGAVERGSALTRRLVSFTRKRALKPKCNILSVCVEETVKLVQRTVGEHISVSVNLAEDSWMTLADAGEIDSAVLNLVANARDAMPKGGSIRIATSNATLDASGAARLNAEARPGDYVCLAVADDGPGMSEEVLSRATDPFFTTKALGAGTGLGLTIIADFARQAGGFTLIDSAPGHGCAVSIYLPRAEKESAAPALSRSSGSIASKQLILLVEDDDEVREVTRKRLEALGYSVIEAKTVFDAIEQLHCHRETRLVLSDVVMPGGRSGYDLERWVASNRPSVKVILCSGYNEGDRGEHAQEMACHVVVLAKPYTKAQLAQALEDAFAEDAASWT
jgi:PAS domain S-box-containing protein